MKLLHNPLLRSFLFGTFVFSVQLFFVLLATALITSFVTGIYSIDIKNLWLSLASRWDAGWYASIAYNGYQVSPIDLMNQQLGNTNTAFLPGYPYLVRCIFLLFKINIKVALLIVSQGAAWLFWCVLFYILKDARYRVQFYAAGLILAFPTSWTFMMGQSESLFTLFCVVTIFCATQNRWLLAACAGILMTGTRMFGVPVLFAPFFSKLFAKNALIKTYIKEKKYLSILKLFKYESFLIIFGSFGFLGFLFYTYTHFHMWDLYFKVEKIGWGASPSYNFLFNNIRNWIPIGTYNRKFFALFLWLSIYFGIILLYKPQPEKLKSMTWFLAGLFAGMIGAVASANRDFSEMTRFLLPAWVCFVLSDFSKKNHIVFFSTQKTKKRTFFTFLLFALFIYFWSETLYKFYHKS